jgi:hypothetical protein
MSRAFTGVLAVLHRSTSDGRCLNEPADELTRPLPLPLVRPSDSTPAGPAGRINRVWRDGDLIRYSGYLNDAHPQAQEIAAGIEAGQLLGMLDAEGGEMEYRHEGLALSDDELVFTDEPTGVEMVMSGWRVAAATLMPAEGRAWPEVSLTLAEHPPTGYRHYGAHPEEN